MGSVLIDGEWVEKYPGTKDLGVSEGDRIEFDHVYGRGDDKRVLTKEGVVASITDGIKARVVLDSGKEWGLYCGAVRSYEGKNSASGRYIGSLIDVRKIEE